MGPRHILLSAHGEHICGARSPSAYYISRSGSPTLSSAGSFCRAETNQSGLHYPLAGGGGRLRRAAAPRPQGARQGGAPLPRAIILTILFRRLLGWAGGGCRQRATVTALARGTRLLAV